MYNLSIVNIIPDQHRDQVNQLAEAFGCGSNNLSVKLTSKEGTVFWGCHSWWKQEDYDKFFNTDAVAQLLPEALDAVKDLYTKVGDSGEPLVNWNEALEELGLTRVVEGGEA